MNQEELQEALDHDVAQKAQGVAGGTIVHPGVTVGVADVAAIEIRQAYLAKAVSLSYVDAAHACVRLALQEVSPVVDLTDADPNSIAKQKPAKADPKRVDLLMNLGERAVKIARELDILGDKALVRYEEEPGDGPNGATEQ